MDVKNEVQEFFKNKFNKHLIVVLILLGLVIMFFEYTGTQTPETDGKLIIHFFYADWCSHCAEQKPFNEKLENEFPNIRIIKHNIDIPSERNLHLMMAQNFSIIPEKLGTPTTIFGNKIFIGFVSEETTGKKIRDDIADCLKNGCNNENATVSNTPYSSIKDIDLPFFGKIDLTSLSLPMLAVTLGLLDGFNPCAMWVLVYLIGILMNLNDKKRLALVVGTFLLASGILYFLFMTAWLNAFLFIGYVRAVTILVGIVALGGGILSLKEFIETKGVMVCKVVNSSEKVKFTDRMRAIVSAPLTLATFIGIVFLAFAINSIEFVCSAAIPAVFTQILALSKLSTLEYYGYIILYDFFFMLDDLVIFGSAFLILNNAGEKYASYCKIIGGMIMLILGTILLFAPNLLR